MTLKIKKIDQAKDTGLAMVLILLIVQYVKHPCLAASKRSPYPEIGNRRPYRISISLPGLGEAPLPQWESNLYPP